MQQISNKKHIYTNTNQQVALEEQARRDQGYIQQVCDTFAALGLGPFSEQDLVGTERAYSGSSSSGCRTCQGVLAYAKTQSFIEDKLVEQAESSPQIAGVKLSTQKLKQFVELPEESKIIAFDQALKLMKSRVGYMGSFSMPAYISIVNGKAIINEQLEKQKEQLAYYASSEAGIQLMEDIEKLSSLLTSVNTRLKQINLNPLPLPTDGGDKGFVIYSNHNTGHTPKVNLPLLASRVR